MQDFSKFNWSSLPQPYIVKKQTDFKTSWVPFLQTVKDISKSWYP